MGAALSSSATTEELSPVKVTRPRERGAAAANNRDAMGGPKASAREASEAATGTPARSKAGWPDLPKVTPTAALPAE